MNSPKVTLDQWRALIAVIDYGGFSQAANKLNKSQSSVSHAVNKLQDLLGFKILHIQGRKAVLSDAGLILLERARQLLKDACAIEQQALHLGQGWEAEIRLAVETAFPTHVLMKALKAFEPISNKTRIRLQEVVLSGAEEVLLNGKADLLISPYVPQGFLGQELIQVKFTAVAHPEHRLFKLGHKLNTHDLTREIQVIVSDSGNKGINTGWLSDSQRWAVNSLESARKIISSGLGFAWLPESEIKQQLNDNELKALPLNEGASYTAVLYLIYPDLSRVGPATKQLAEILKAVSV
ncbi:MAG: LysR family transcriptional regulator [Gammaproteobacteria bacterium]|nr:LysR family transcriptional regulator [Gammaproteobacteria bacterium]